MRKEELIPDNNSGNSPKNWNKGFFLPEMKAQPFDVF
jgi:hypothetical protein